MSFGHDENTHTSAFGVDLVLFNRAPRHRARHTGELPDSLTPEPFNHAHVDNGFPTF